MINLLILLAAGLTAWLLTCTYNALLMRQLRKHIGDELMRRKCKKIEQFSYAFFRSIYDDKQARKAAADFTRDAFYSGLINEKYEMLR